MRLSSIERFLINRRRSGKAKNNDFCPSYWRVIKGYKPIPDGLDKDPGAMTLDEVAFILRHRSSLTMRQLAEKMDVSHQTIHNREHGTKGGADSQIKFLSGYLKNFEAEYLKMQHKLEV